MSMHTADTIATQQREATGPAADTVPLGFVVGLLALAGALVANTALGPLGSGAIAYPITGTLLNQTIGLEVVTVALVVPALLLAAALCLRRHRAAPFLAFGPAAYAAYMFVQYALGPEYSRYSPQVLFHIAVFTLSSGVALRAFTLGIAGSLPPVSSRRRHAYGVVLLLLAAFILSRYLPVITGSTLPPEFDEARTFFWSIFLLDLGVVVPATAAAGIAVMRGSRVAHAATYALLGWYALVPASVAAMSITMVVNDDPFASKFQAFLLSVFAVVFLGLAGWVLRPLVPGGAA